MGFKLWIGQGKSTSNWSFNFAVFLHFFLLLSQSPNLNPIENVWMVFKKKVKARNPRNISELKKYCLEEWPKLDLDYCKNLIENYGNRLTQVIRNKGNATKYWLLIITSLGLFLRLVCVYTFRFPFKFILQLCVASRFWKFCLSWLDLAILVFISESCWV